MIASLKRRLAPVVPERPDLDSPGWAMFADHIARYLFAAEFAPGKRVLDAGTGPGYGAAMLRAVGAAGVTAVDIDPASIAQAAARYADSGVEYLADDCETLDKARGPFDLICSFENIEHLPHPERFLEAAAKRLAPGGMLVISTPDRSVTPPFVNGRPANPHHEHEWYRQEFLDLLGRYFGACELRVQVKALGYDRRREAAAQLVRHLRRSNPIFWAVGIATVLMRKRYYWEPILELGTPTPADFPIVPAAVAPFLGSPYCNVVLCTQPRAAAAPDIGSGPRNEDRSRS